MTAGYYLKHLTPEETKLLGNTENKITRHKRKRRYVPHLGITEVILVHCNVVNKVTSQIQEFCIYLFQITNLVGY